MKKKIVIAGATGFIGSALIQQLKNNYDCIGLTRQKSFLKNGVEYRSCDLFSYESTLSALKGADFAIYLIHSMIPQARLSQARFEDLDLWLAENFARAAKKMGIQQIIYLGGIIPRDEKALSPLLRSRLEVEEIFRSYELPVTALRAGLVIGPGGSSFQIMKNLVLRLPFMICPSWTQTLSQPIYVGDVVKSILYCLENTETFKKIYDIGGSDLLSYQEMMKITAKALKKRRFFFSVPAFTPKLSQLWVRLFSQTPKELVYPLIQSLKHSMIVHFENKLTPLDTQFIGFQESLKRTFENEHLEIKKSKNKKSLDKDVISLQRFIRPPQMSAVDVGVYYFNWLKKVLWPFFYVYLIEDTYSICFLFIKTPLLVLKMNLKNDFQTDWIQFNIVGGLLVSSKNTKGILEFREVLRGHFILVCLKEFYPALPWFIYKYSQAVVHLGIMKRFSLALFLKK